MDRNNHFLRKFQKFFKSSDETRKTKQYCSVNNDVEATSTNELNMKNFKLPRISIPSEKVNNSVGNIIKVKSFSNFDILSEEFQNAKDVLVLKVQLTESLDSIEIKKLSQKLKDRSAVVQIESTDDKRLTIYWKSSDIEEFLELQQTEHLSLVAGQKLNEFVADFLAQSLKKRNLGLVSKFSFPTESNLINLDLLADQRDYNLLLLASEQGITEIVDILVKLEISVNSIDNSVNAQTLAINGQHYDILYILLQNNAMFPSSFEISRFTGKLKEFCKVTEEVHKMIRANDSEALEGILEQYKHLRYFYNFSNESALKVAINCGSFETFDLLLSQKIRFGSHEDPTKYYEQLDASSKKKIRDIQDKYCQPFLDKLIYALVSNSRACYDEADAEDKRDYVYRAFKLLNEHPFIKIILMIVAESKNFKIVFDFNREAVNIADPTANSGTQGIFYLSGKIFVGAKQLLDPATEHLTLAVLAHELCHFAMNAAYGNKAKPYRNDDKKSMDEFESVSKKCKQLAEQEKVVSAVYEHYPIEAYHAELIVRVVHLMALYRNLPEKLKEVRNIFDKLFEFYEKKVVPELKQILPEIEGRDKNELKMKDKEISKFKRISIFGGILTVIGIVTAMVVPLALYAPIYKFNELSLKEQKSVSCAQIVYKDVNLKFSDLFPEGSLVYEILLSDHIAQMLKSKPLNFDDSHLRYLDEQVKYDWQNLTKKLREKFLNSEVKFQSKIIKFEALYKITSESFNFLTFDQILSALNGEILIVHKMIEIELKFYIERKFVTEEEFLRHNFNFNEKKAVFLESFSDHNSFFKVANDSKLFILSAEAGTGKTETFEQFTIKIKNNFPTKWVSYVDLKDFKHLYKRIQTLQNVRDMLEIIFELTSKNEFELKVFEHLFETGRVILLWNGFDEISPEFSEDVIRILDLIRKDTENIQFLCTRPLYSEQLREKFSIQPYTLIPFDNKEQENFIKEFLKSQKVEETKIPDFISKVSKIANSTESSDAFDTPLMLIMIAGIIIDEKRDIYKSENLFDIYWEFINAKIEDWMKKSKTYQMIIKNSFANDFTIFKIYQVFAMKSEFKSNLFSNAYFYCLKLKTNREEIPKSLTNDEISRMAILYMNGPKKFKFAHKTFQEFLIAQYLIANIYNAKDEPSDLEAEMRILVLYESFHFPGVVRFLKSFLQSKLVD